MDEMEGQSLKVKQNKNMLKALLDFGKQINWGLQRYFLTQIGLSYNFFFLQIGHVLVIFLTMFCTNNVYLDKCVDEKLFFLDQKYS